MDEIAAFFERALLKNENLKKIQADVKEFRRDLQDLHYCFKKGFRGYDYHELI